MDYKVDNDKLTVFPYFNSDNYILIERITLSDNSFWECITHNYTNTPNLVNKGSYSLFTMESGVTLGYVKLSDEIAYLVRTDSLPSSYVQRMCDQL